MRAALGGVVLGCFEGHNPPMLTQPNWGCGASGGFIHRGRKRHKPQSLASKPTRVGAPRVPGGSSRALGAVAPSRRLLGVPRVPSQHWLQGDGPSPRRPSRDSVVPVGVGGVTMMEGTCRCFCPDDAVAVPSLPLLTHIFKPGEILGGIKAGQAPGCSVPQLPALLDVGTLILFLFAGESTASSHLLPCIHLGFWGVL